MRGAEGSEELAFCTSTREANPATTPLQCARHTASGAARFLRRRHSPYDGVQAGGPHGAYVWRGVLCAQRHRRTGGRAAAAGAAPPL